MQGKRQTQITKNGTQTLNAKPLGRQNTSYKYVSFFLNIMSIQQKYSGTSNALGFFHLLNYKTVGYFTLYKI